MAVMMCKGHNSVRTDAACSLLSAIHWKDTGCQGATRRTSGPTTPVFRPLLAHGVNSGYPMEANHDEDKSLIA